MITIIFGKPRAGKTALMTHLLREVMFDYNRFLNMKRCIKRLEGFNLSIPKHCVFANYEIVGYRHGYRPRKRYPINPFKLGFQDGHEVDTVFLPPYAAIGITEGQKYFNSRMSYRYPDWQSRFMEQHGHYNLDIFIDVQRPMLIDINIRELAEFIEICDKKDICDSYGNIKKIKWTVRHFVGAAELDKYFSSGRKDETTYQEDKIIADYDVHRCYDSQMCKPKFMQGHLDEDFDLIEDEPLQETKDGYIEYLNNFDDELPRGFYKTK